MVESTTVQSCPQCGSVSLYKDGLRYTNQGPIQRWLCRNCGYRFSQPNVKLNITRKLGKTLNSGSDLLKGSIVNRDFTFQESLNDLPFSNCEDVGSHKLTVVGKGLNTFASYNRNAKVCVLDKEAKNLATVENQTATERESTATADVKGKLIEFSFHMKKEGLAEATITTFTCLLKKLMENGADLLNPESVKETLAKINISPNSKATMKGAYTCFLNFLGKSWKPPKYNYQQKIPFIPLESELDQLIAGCGKTTSAILQTLKETGMRIGEALRLKWTDVNVQNNTIILNEPEKNSNPRIFRVSPKLIGMLQVLPKKYERVFGKGNVRDKQNIFRCQRKKLARKLGNPRLAQITFHTLRHWKGTMEYHKTHDPWHVKTLLGHKSLKSTEIYINIEQAIFNENDQEFHVKVAANLEEACKLLEVGFEYVTDMDDKKLFRKRK